MLPFYAHNGIRNSLNISVQQELMDYAPIYCVKQKSRSEWKLVIEFTRLTLSALRVLSQLH